MGRTIINYNLVAQSSKNIGKTADEVTTSSGINEELPDLITSIISEGKGHDNCLSSFEGDLDNIISDMQTSTEMMYSLADLCMVAFDAFLEAESNIKDGVSTITINGTEFPNVKIESTGMKEYVNSLLDTDNLAGSINPNNLEGPLSEEEWQRYELMFTKAMNEATTKKEKAAVAAIFMTSVYPHMPYDWGGGHHNEYSNDYSIVKEIGETYNGTWCNFQENPRLHTFDCSGFVAWVLKEAGYPESTWAYYEQDIEGRPGGGNVDMIVANSKNRQELGANFDSDNCSVGDIAYMVGEDDTDDTVFKGDHIGVIVAKEGDVITVAHVSAGSSENNTQAESAGFGYTKINVKTGEVLEDSTCKRDERVKKVYFTHTASVNEE